MVFSRPMIRVCRHQIGTLECVIYVFVDNGRLKNNVPIVDRNGNDAIWVQCKKFIRILHALIEHNRVFDNRYAFLGDGKANFLTTHRFGKVIKL